MTEFVIKIDEAVTHSMVIEADTAGEALQLGYQLLTDGMSEPEKILYDYQLEANGYLGTDSVWEL